MSLNPLQAYQAYKNTQQPTNSSSYSYGSNPSGNYGSNPPPVVTAREILAARNTIPQGPPPSSIQRGGGVLDSPVPSAGEIAHFAPAGPVNITPTPKPSQVISAANLAKSNSLRQAAGLGPLQDAENVIVKPSFSQGTNSFRADTLQTLNDLGNAKAEGLTSLDIFDSKGNKIGTTNPQDITRARYDILQASLASGGPVTASGQAQVKTLSTTSTTGPDYFRKNDNIVKSTLASLVEPGAYIGLAFAGGAADVLGKPVLGVKPGATQEDINRQIESKIGPTYLDQILSGNYNSNNMTPAEKVASLIGSGVGLYLTGGGTGAKSAVGRIGSSLRNIPGGLEDLAKGTFKDSGVISKIASGLKENNIIQNVGPRETVSGVLEKGSPLRELSQGTAGKSGIDSFTVEKSPSYYEKNLSTEPGQAPYVKVEPSLPSYLKETTDITGIGPKGEPKTFTTPTNVKLEPGLEGQAQNPYALINPKGATAIVRGGTQNVLPPDKILVEFQGMNPLEAAGNAVHYGLEEVPGTKNVYFGRATPDLISRLSGGIKSGVIKEGTDIFQFGSKDFARNSGIYGEVTRNPELFKSPTFGKGGAFESISRPSVIRYFVGGVRNKAAQIGKNQLVPGKKSFRSFSKGDFSLNDIGAGKVGAGAAGRAVNLLKNIEVDTKNFGKTGSNVVKERYDPLGTVLPLEQRRSRGRGRGGDVELETLAYPSVLHVGQIGEVNTRTRSGQRAGLLSNVGLDQVNSMIQKTKQKSNLNDLTKLVGSGRVTSKDKTDSLTSLRFKQETGQQTRTTTKQITDQINIPVQITTRGPRNPGRIKLAGGMDINWDWPTGNKKRRKGFTKTSFFSYSVNPDVPGVIAEAGAPGKAVSVRPIRFRGSGRGPKLSDIGKGFKINIGGNVRGGNIGGKIGRGGGVKVGGRRGRGTALYGIDLGL